MGTPCKGGSPWRWVTQPREGFPEDKGPQEVQELSMHSEAPDVGRGTVCSRPGHEKDLQGPSEVGRAEAHKDPGETQACLSAPRPLGGEAEGRTAGAQEPAQLDTAVLQAGVTLACLPPSPLSTSVLPLPTGSFRICSSSFSFSSHPLPASSSLLPLGLSSILSCLPAPRPVLLFPCPVGPPRSSEGPGQQTAGVGLGEAGGRQE